LGLSFDSYAQNKSNSTYANAWITDVDTNNTPLQVVSDTLNLTDRGTLYRDYRLSGGDQCVTAFGGPAFLMYPHKSDCPTTPIRSFRLYLPSTAMDYPSFTTNCETTRIYDGARGQYYVNAWRMYFPNLYGTTSRKVTVVTTPVQFGFFCYSGSNKYAYAIKMNEDMAPATDSTDNTIRKLKNTDVSKLASLYTPQNGELIPTPVKDFPFTFDITVQLPGK
jgi:hypothetical protein